MKHAHRFAFEITHVLKDVTIYGFFVTSQFKINFHVNIIKYCAKSMR